MFIRKKHIKGQDYAYLVQNTWTTHGPRQHVTAYLGKIYTLTQTTQTPFPHIDIEHMNYQDAVQAILIWNIETLGFKPTGNHYFKDNLIIDPAIHTVKNTKGKEAIIQRDQGYLCSHTLTTIYKFSMQGHEEEVGFALAKAFVDAGLSVPKEVFVQIFEKIWKPTN
ncbi:MAG: hypothetical protein AABX52_03840 [Nanoarchaeota archaeon]